MSKDPLAWIDDALTELDQRNLRRVATVREGRQSASTKLSTNNGTGKLFVNFSSNDYLGLANDPRITSAVAAALETEGWGSGASPLVTGRAVPHALLESKLAEFEQTESALLFPTGFAANAGSIPAIVGRGDWVFSDAKNHASIIDGCRLSGANVVVYNHVDPIDLHEKLSAAQGGRKLIVTDGLFSMDGNFAPLPEIADLAEQHDAMLMVDEAHATGVIGENGRGVCEHFGIEDRVSLRVGTLSKALGSHSGFVVGEQRVIDWLRNRSRAYVFSTAAPAVVAQAGITALEIVHDEPQRRQALMQKAASVRERLRDAGMNLGKSCSQIVPVILGDASRTMKAARELRDRGILVPGIRPPSVPDGESLLRISISYTHTDDMLDELVSFMQELVESV